MSQALAAKGSASEIHILNSIILVVSIASALGAAWMIISFLLFKAVRTFRHQLVLGLAISDLLTAVNFMISSAINLSGHSIGAPAQRHFCGFNGFATQWFVIQSDYWILIIAVCTFLLVGDYQKGSDWVQKHRVSLWCLPWGVSGLWAAIGLGVVGYGNIGAWCWFTSDRTGFLVNFIPRWTIITFILVIYLRLAYLLHRAHSKSVSQDIESVLPPMIQRPSTPKSAFDNYDNDERTAPSPVVRPGPDLTEPEACHHSPARVSKHLPPFSLTMLRSKSSICALHSAPPPQQRKPVLKTLSYQMITYPLVYMLIWILPTAVRIYQIATGRAVVFEIGLLDKACIVLQGVVNAVVYGWSERMGVAWGSWLGIGERGWR